MKTNVILVGAFHEVIELCEECRYDIVGIIDNNIIGEYYGIPIIGKDSDAKSLFFHYGNCKLIITPDSPIVRKKLVDYYNSIGYKFATLVSPLAKISKYADIGEGNVIQSGVNVSSNTHIGNFCKLNTYCNVMHDNIIGNFCSIAPNAVLLGRVTIGNQVYIGANSTILPEITVEDKAVVGAGSVVTKIVKTGTTVKGVPAK